MLCDVGVDAWVQTSEQASKRAGRAACAAWVLLLYYRGEQERERNAVVRGGFCSELAGLGLNSLDLDLYVCMYVRRVRGVE